MKKIPSILIPIIENKNFLLVNLNEYLNKKNVIIFGVPGAFTPTCSELHLPSFLEYYDQIKEKGFDDIFCMSVNDKYVMQSWLLSYDIENKIKGIADGNGEVSKNLNFLIDKTSSFMGLRCKRFAMIVQNNFIKNIFFEDPINVEKTYAKNILKHL
tara:strand:- start:43 stop:510 length:468 start_codon:yes stop_codon:yes gene_type:complete